MVKYRVVRESLQRVLLLHDVCRDELHVLVDVARTKLVIDIQVVSLQARSARTLLQLFSKFSKPLQSSPPATDAGPLAADRQCREPARGPSRASLHVHRLVLS